MAVVNPISLSVRLQNALNQQAIIVRCQEVTQLLQEVSSKDASNILRIIIESLFGASEDLLNPQQHQLGGGWGLRIITVSEHRYEFHTLRTFLSPTGPLLSLIYRLSHDPFQLLPFPIAWLPVKVRSEIQNGNAGAFYMNKIQNLGPGKIPSNILFNPFEFYIFHFGHFLIGPNSQRWDLFWTSVKDALYPTLLEDYLSSFLSCNAAMPPGPPSPPISPRGILSPVAAQRSCVGPLHQLHSTNLHNFGLLVSPIPRPVRCDSNPLLDVGPGGLISAGTQTSSPLHSISPQPEVNIWTSHVIIQVLMEIWINLCIPPPANTSTHQPAGTFPSSITSHSHPPLHDVFVPSSDHVRAVRMVIKHFHYFSNSLKAHQPSPLDPLRRNIWPMCRKSLYLFLKHLFTHWPLDSSFRLVLETWLSYIQPWRYAAYVPLQSVASSPIDGEVTRYVEGKWKGFIADNLLFYTYLYSIFLKRVLRLDLASAKNAQILFRVAKVFSQENLMVMIQEVEELVETNQIQKSFLGLVGTGFSSPSTVLPHQHNVEGQPSPQAIIQMVRSHILEVERQNYHYEPMFSEAVAKDVQRLTKLIKVAHDNVKAEMNYTSGSRGTSEKQSRGRLRWLQSFVHSLFESPLSKEDENNLEETQKCLTHLDLSMLHFCHMFNMSPPETSLMTSLSVSQNSQFHSLSKTSLGALGTPEKCHSPEQTLTDTGLTLTQFGRHQLLHGMRRFDLKYEGDPDLKPISTFEIGFLVRLLYALSKRLNAKYEAELIDCFYRRDFLGSFSRVVLMPPETIFEYRKDIVDSPQKRIPKDLPPRIGLRFLANKKGWFFFILFFVILRLFGFSSFQVIIKFILPIAVAYLVWKAAFQHYTSSPSLRIGGLQPLNMDAEATNENISLSHGCDPPVNVNTS